MLRRVIAWMDSASINMMLGSLLKEVTASYKKSGFVDKQAQQLASQEIKISLAANNIDLQSYQQVKAWRRRYMAERAKPTIV
jgi:hypothetical protein